MNRMALMNDDSDPVTQAMTAEFEHRCAIQRQVRIQLHDQARARIKTLRERDGLLIAANVRDKTLDPALVEEVLDWVWQLEELGLADAYFPPRHKFVNVWFGHGLFPNEGKRVELEDVMTEWYTRLKNHPAIAQRSNDLLEAVLVAQTWIEPEDSSIHSHPWTGSLRWMKTQAKRVHRLLAPTMLLLVLSGIAACDVLPSQNTGGGANGTPSPSISHGPPTAAVYCPEKSGKYPLDLFQQANAYVALSLDEAVTAGQDGLNVVVLPITATTYDATKSGSFTIQIPPTDPAPEVPTLVNGRLDPVPTIDPSNYYPSAAKRNAALAHNQQVMDAYNAALAHEQAQLEQLRARVKVQTDRLRGFNPPLDSAHPDDSSVWGCALKASQILAGQSGPRWLIFASALDESHWQDTRPLQLTGVRVRVIDYYQIGQTSQFAQYKQGTWEKALRAAGVTDLKFFDPQASSILPPIWAGSGI